MWIVLAFLSSIFAALSTILAKCGIKQTGSTLATALRTVVVLVFSWLIVLFTGKASGIAAIEAKSWIFLVLSGLATGASWLCYFSALKNGQISIVAPIDKLSVVFVVIFSWLFLGEKAEKKSVLGLLLMTVGTLMTIL